MAAVFNVSCDGDGCRAGVLTLDSGRHRIATPTLAVPYRRGGVPYVTKDLLRKVCSPEDTLLQASLFDCQAYEGLLTGSGRGLLDTSGYGEYPLLLTPRCPFGGPFVSQCNGKVMAAENDSGRVALTDKLFRTIVGYTKPSLVTPLFDTCSLEAGSKKMRLAMQRSESWRSSCLSDSAVNALVRPPLDASDGLEAKHDFCSEGPPLGYFFCDIFQGETPEQRSRHLAFARGVERCSTSGCPCASRHPMRYLSCCPSIAAIVEAISCGIDVVETSLPFVAAREGVAVVVDANSGVCEPGAVLRLWEAGYQTDRSPILPGCECPTCKVHSRAYVNHLLSVHEMTATVLLTMHNIHNLRSMVARLRDAIVRGDFALVSEHVMNQLD